MISVDYMRYSVHCFLNKQNIMHYCQGTNMANSDFRCLVFCLQGQQTIENLYSLHEYEHIKFFNIHYSQKSGFTYLEVLF